MRSILSEILNLLGRFGEPLGEFLKFQHSIDVLINPAEQLVSLLLLLSS